MDVAQKEYDLAVSCLQKGDNSQALEKFKNVLKIDNKHVLGQHYFGLLSISLGKGVISSAQAMNRALRSDPSSKIMRDNHFGIALVAYREGKKSIAMLLLEFASSLLKNDLELISNLARIYLLNNKAEQAWELLEKVEIQKDFNCLFYQAVSAKFMNRENQATQLFNQALRLNPLQVLGMNNKHAKSEQKAKVLVCFATEKIPFQVHAKNEQIAFSISGGHFSTDILLRGASVSQKQLFISGSKACQQYLADIDQYDVVINAISDPEIAKESLTILQEGLVGKNVRLINPPEFVLPTTREEIYQRIAKIPQVLMAQTWQLKLQGSAEQCKKQLADIEPPYLLRPLGSSTGVGLSKIDNIEEINPLLPSLNNQVLNICPFINFKSADGRYRKYRVFVIGGDIYPEHCVISNHWNVHSSSRLILMRDNDQYRKEEERFTADISNVLNAKQLRAIKDIADVLKLDYFGIDFSLMDDGTLLVFEANSGMRVNSDYNQEFPYLRPAIEKICLGFGKMLNNKLQQKL